MPLAFLRKEPAFVFVVVVDFVVSWTLLFPLHYFFFFKTFKANFKYSVIFILFFLFFLLLFLSSVHSVTTSKILISGIPLQTRFEDIEPLLKPYGIVKQCEAVSSKDPQTQTVHITFENNEQAQRYSKIFSLNQKQKTNFNTLSFETPKFSLIR